jgi:hypothetical protein
MEKILEQFDLIGGLRQKPDVPGRDTPSLDSRQLSKAVNQWCFHRVGLSPTGVADNTTLGFLFVGCLLCGLTAK